MITLLNKTSEAKVVLDEEAQNGSILYIDHGTIELKNKHIKAPKGIIGFEEETQYTIELLDEQAIYRMKGASGSPIFYLINPYLFLPYYTLSISNEEYELLQRPYFNDIIVFAILTLSENITDTTCNLLGPLLINNKESILLQVINNSDGWGTKHLLDSGEKITTTQDIIAESESEA